MTLRAALPVTIRAGIIGGGYAARIFHVPLIGAPDGMEVAMIAARRPEVARAAFPNIACRADPDSLLADPTIDLIVVATPNDSHADWALAALRAGKHVVVEKPFALDLDQAQTVAAQAQRAGRVLAVFHNRRWDSDFLSIKAALAGGSIGTPVHFESHFDRFRPAVRARWREDDRPGSGIWYDLGPHLIDQALQLFGLPDAICANVGTLRSGARADDWVHAVLIYPAHRVVLHASMVVRGPSPRFIVHGTRGSLVKRGMDVQEAQSNAGLVPGRVGWGVDPDPLLYWSEAGERREIAPSPGDQRAFYGALRLAILGAGPNPVPADQALATMAVLDAGRRSAAEGRTIALS